jgi:putative ABC transport system substrate-binding protein
VERLRDLGWIEGRTIAIEVRWAEGRRERFAEIAAEFVRLKVDVIVTGGDAVVAAKQATSTIPIVFAIALDPLGSGVVASLARPGGNVTGLSLQSADAAGKALVNTNRIRINTLALVGRLPTIYNAREIIEATKPWATGSAMATNTMGVVLVARRATTA